MVLKIKFDDPNPPLDKDPKILLEHFPFTLPNSFLKILKEHDGGDLDYDFKYYDNFLKIEFGSGIGVLFGLNHKYNILQRYHSLPSFFPKRLVPFGEDGGGDSMCFDYRKDPHSNDPPIVYWAHENEEGKDISFLARNFKEFLSILKEPKD